MTRLLFSELLRGKRIQCEQCKRTSTLQDEGRVPSQWYAVMDSKMTFVLFCSMGCISHFTASKKQIPNVQLAIQDARF